MTIELSTATDQSPLEVLDLQVTSRRSSGKSVLSLRFLCNNDRYTNHMQIPTLSWFDASQMQRFSQNLAVAHYPETCQVDLLDAGIRLTGSVRQLAGRWTTGRTVRIEPLPSAMKQFEPFTIHASSLDVKTYSGKLYNRLWELFTKG
ncbi:hypothetical protein EXU85_18640 [Spirosoma sp. KCTC 42546]|uniref:hypothetical protein n=1 Tax=Spirosoma sp. KCTC 42546 TaxID=2520506 RepID=UPI001158163D|nr:hypothetical protein [Spirosoma sp. KCTC 42546]QDK80512.1 hypothetical protein EXU85_18640 [Spirosoma sp. KCTC 42546]